MIDFKNGALIKMRKSASISHQADVEPLLTAGETCVAQYEAARDYVVFTSKRIISVNVQGMTGKKKDFTSLPYSKIQAFSVETAGSFDMDAELELYFSGLGKVKFEISGKNDIVAIGKYISDRIL